MTTTLKEALALPKNVTLHPQTAVSGAYTLHFMGLTEDEVRKLVGFYKFINGLQTHEGAK